MIIFQSGATFQWKHRNQTFYWLKVLTKWQGPHGLIIWSFEPMRATKNGFWGPPGSKIVIFESKWVTQTCHFRIQRVLSCKWCLLVVYHVKDYIWIFSGEEKLEKQIKGNKVQIKNWTSVYMYIYIYIQCIYLYCMRVHVMLLGLDLVTNHTEGCVDLDLCMNTSICIYIYVYNYSYISPF